MHSKYDPNQLGC